MVRELDTLRAAALSGVPEGVRINHALTRAVAIKGRRHGFFACRPQRESLPEMQRSIQLNAPWWNTLDEVQRRVYAVGWACGWALKVASR